MKHTEEDDILKKIIDKNGDCMQPETMCRACPFRDPCLLSHLGNDPITPQERVGLALDKLARSILLEDDS